MFDLYTGASICVDRISSQTVFATCRHTSTHGLMAVNTAGQVFSVCVDENHFP